MVKSEKRVTEGPRHTNESPVLAVTRYSHRVAIARTQAMAAQNALIVQEACCRYVYYRRHVDSSCALRPRERVCWHCRL